MITRVLFSSSMIGQINSFLGSSSLQQRVGAVCLSALIASSSREKSRKTLKKSSQLSKISVQDRRAINKIDQLFSNQSKIDRVFSKTGEPTPNKQKQMEETRRAFGRILRSTSGLSLRDKMITKIVARRAKISVGKVEKLFLQNRKLKTQERSQIAELKRGLDLKLKNQSQSQDQASPLKKKKVVPIKATSEHKVAQAVKKGASQPGSLASTSQASSKSSKPISKKKPIQLKRKKAQNQLVSVKKALSNSGKTLSKKEIEGLREDDKRSMEKAFASFRQDNPTLSLMIQQTRDADTDVQDYSAFRATDMISARMEETKSMKLLAQFFDICGLIKDPLLKDLSFLRAFYRFSDMHLKVNLLCRVQNSSVRHIMVDSLVQQNPSGVDAALFANLGQTDKDKMFFALAIHQDLTRRHARDFASMISDQEIKEKAFLLLTSRKDSNKEDLEYAHRILLNGDKGKNEKSRLMIQGLLENFNDPMTVSLSKEKLKPDNVAFGKSLPQPDMPDSPSSEE